MIPRLALLGAILVAAGRPAYAQSSPTPTATEIFHLRSECAALGQKLLEDNVIVSALSQTQVSHYDPQTNRCYVELMVQSANLNKPMTYFTRTLYDGQTGEMLAHAKIENKDKSGIVFDRQHQPTTDKNAGWDDANDYMDERMADDRKR